MEELKNIIENNYNLNNIKIVKNGESTDGNVYNIESSQGKYILKIYNDKNHTNAMVNLLNELNKKDFYVPKVLVNKENKKYTQAGDKFYVLYSFLEGEPIENLDYISNDISKKLANELKRFHSECANLNNIGLEKIDFFENASNFAMHNNLEKKNLMNFAMYNDLEKKNFKKSTLHNDSITKRNLRKSVLHFDLTKGNIFYNKKSGRIGFIDFDDAKYGEAVIDIAILITNLYFSRTRETNTEGIKAFLDEYYKNNDELKKMEVPLIKEASIKWIDYVLKRNVLNLSTTESFKIKRKKIDSFVGMDEKIWK